ncbi:MAG: phytanoyl-CoA dioxygenase family protein [Caldilineaceae bacterium]|nr:phytanoyl-CoA dioxygenase family protein [Caldilineaceae bacterium]MCB9150797.1 phytanoyl-CoA dioxygenase family protein [Caldilineaceae bacterium]MCB9158161.1 phytanoyl-CoA dioxygenase family protein [Caldilineaceae bacterium]
MANQTVDKQYLLNSKQMASFVARGFLRFDELIPQEINEAVMAEIDAGTIKSQPAGTPLSQCYPEPSAIGHMLRMPEVQGIIQSLVGPDPAFDHHAIHVRQPMQGQAQGMHGDSIIDTRMHFDVQLMYFPHDVPLEMGGTLIVPGSHFRRVNEMDIARYQNFVGQIPMVCKAGSILALHHGIWHCGRRNETEKVRYMYKIRLNPRVRQLRLWNTDDLDESAKAHRTIYGGSSHDPEDVQTILGKGEPWFEDATGRLEFVNRIKLWRFITGDDTFDVHYWLTRLENTPENLALAA